MRPARSGVGERDSWCFVFLESDPQRTGRALQLYRLSLCADRRRSRGESEMMPDSTPGFPATHWSLIARVKSPDEGEASKALEELCAQYHYPLYCYLRRRGCDHHDSQDVLQDFFALLLRR